MTSDTSVMTCPARSGGLAGRVGAALTGLSDRVHAEGDAYARTVGWTVTPARGPLGLDDRVYRDPRFNTLGRR